MRLRLLEEEEPKLEMNVSSGYGVTEGRIVPKDGMLSSRVGTLAEGSSVRGVATLVGSRVTMLLPPRLDGTKMHSRNSRRHLAHGGSEGSSGFP